MADKELKRFRRSELIEIIYELKKNEQKLQEENAELKRRLEEREVKIQNVGSLAEAALALSDIFTAAEESVAIYVNEIKRRHDTLDTQKNETEKQESDDLNIDQ